MVAQRSVEMTVRNLKKGGTFQMGGRKMTPNGVFKAASNLDGKTRRGPGQILWLSAVVGESNEEMCWPLWELARILEK